MRATGRHQCRWPQCERIVSDDFWGCRDHWELIPKDVRWQFTMINARGLPESEQSTECLSELARIDQWVRENHEAAALSAATQNGDRPEFACGCTSDGLLMMLWPRKGEYVTLTKEEARIVARGMRGLFAEAAA